MPPIFFLCNGGVLSIQIATIYIHIIYVEITTNTFPMDVKYIGERRGKGMKKVENGILEVTGDVFVIPNCAVTTKKCEGNPRRERYQKEMESLLAASGVASPFGEEIVMFESWIVLEDDLDTDNLADHPGHFIGTDGKEHSTGHILNYLPAALFEGKVEGDVVDIKIPIGLFKFNPDFSVILHLTLDQKNYRYRSFGNFENALDHAAGRLTSILKMKTAKGA